MPGKPVVAAALAVVVGVLAVALGSGPRGGGGDHGGEVPVATTLGPGAPGGGPLPAEAGQAVTDLRTAAGAEGAAVRFLMAGPGLVAMDEAAAVQAQRAMATRAAAEGLVGHLRRQLGELRAGFGPGPLGWWVAPLATRVAEVGPDQASVAVWYVSVVAPPGLVAYQDWRLVRYRLAWEGGRWRVAAEEDGPGPRPLALARPEPTAPGALTAALAGFSLLASGR